jgi:hypothetical protein
MRKIVAILLLVATGVAARGQKVTLSRLSVERDGGALTLSFHLDVARRLARGTRLLVLAPVVRDEVNKWSFSPVVIREGAGRVSWKDPLERQAVHARGGEGVDYSATIPLQPWMEGARLVLETLDAGRDGVPVVRRKTLVDTLLLPGALFAAVDGALPRVSTADRLAGRFTYLLPAGEAAVDGAFDDGGTGGLDILFRQSSSRLEPEREDNWEALSDLISTLRAIEYSGDSRVKRVLVAGFASPEGFFETNERLARRRAAAVKEYILRHSSLTGSEVLIHDGAEDWGGLRALVEQSYMPDRARVLEVIDNVPIWDAARQVGREGVLMRMNGGRSYRYMLEYFFPRLRHAALVWVYYENVPATGESRASAGGAE